MCVLRQHKCPKIWAFVENQSKPTAIPPRRIQPTCRCTNMCITSVLNRSAITETVRLFVHFFFCHDHAHRFYHFTLLIKNNHFCNICIGYHIVQSLQPLVQWPHFPCKGKLRGRAAMYSSTTSSVTCFRFS